MKSHARDKQLSEFERKDLGADVRKSKSATSVTPKSRVTSIVLPETLISELKGKAVKRGIGYQTMLKIILTEQLRRY